MLLSVDMNNYHLLTIIHTEPCWSLMFIGLESNKGGLKNVKQM